MNPINFPSQKALRNIERAIPKMKSPSEALAFYYWVPEQSELTSLKNPQVKPDQSFSNDHPMSICLTAIFPTKSKSRRIKVACSCCWWDHDRNELGKEFEVQAFCNLGPYEKWPYSWKITSIASIVEAEE